MRSELLRTSNSEGGGGGGLFWSCWPNNQWTVGRTLSHNRTLTHLDPRMEPWTDVEPVILTSDLLRDPRSIKCCHASPCM